VNHPNRSKHSTAPKAPKPSEIRASRDAVGLTQSDAARLVYVTLSAWQRWEAGERTIHPAMWELWQIKTEGMR
jgi:DNA (cytosine-5)-methyltransferase 1